MKTVRNYTAQKTALEDMRSCGLNVSVFRYDTIFNRKKFSADVLNIKSGRKI